MNRNLFFSEDVDVDHFGRRDDVFIFAHNNGTDKNVHFNKISVLITDDKPCKRIQTGGSIAKNVAEFNKRSLQYFEDHEGCRFPPSYYLKNDSTRQWADKMEKDIVNIKSVKMLVGYNPIIHLQLLGLEKNEYEQIIDSSAATTYENSVIVINNNKRWVMVSVVTDKTDHTSIGMELNKLDCILKTIYHANLNHIKHGYIAIVGILVCPNINSRSELKNCPSVRWDSDVDQLFVTKTEWESEKALNRWKKFILGKTKSEIQNNCSGLSNLPADTLMILAGTTMASISQTVVYLPKPTEHLPTKITTILLNQHQIEAVQYKAKFKILKASFGGGKTVVLSEIAKNLLEEVFTNF